ncbi:hypothetical protein ACIREE_15270 [Streptomyces sp. NPDC102467]|uniref:hypothetical protein n=1 Tax=Streptomyces sp. NPDC102467 TaxID=3366179 RepID=UPI0038206246
MPKPQRLEKPLDSFVREIALCVATNGDKGPALFWPENFHTLPELQRLARSVRPPGGWPYGAGTWLSPTDGPPRRSGAVGPEAEGLAAALGELLGLLVRPSYRFLPSAAVGARQASRTAEYMVTVLDGACRCRVTRDADAAGGPPSDAVDLRLRAGGTLFVPRDHAYDLLDVHTPTVLMELVLSETD